MPEYIGQDAIVNIPAPDILTGETMSAVQRAKSSMLTDAAESSFLSAVGMNYGVPRPNLTVSDDTYRQLIQLLAWQPKTILFTLYKLMGIIFGTQAELVNSGTRPWKIFEVNANEIIIELPTAVTVTSNEGASYLHGWYGTAGVAAGPSNTFTTTGDVTSASGQTLTGRSCYVFYSGVWNAYTVSSATYNSTTNVSTVVLSASTVPTGGGLFYIDIPGDGAASFRGDFLATSDFFGLFTTAAGPTTNTVTLPGDVTWQLSVGHVMNLVFSGVVNAYTIQSMSYSPTTLLTTIVMTASTIPGGLTNETMYRERDVSDTATTPDHDDRVYLTGLGGYEIVSYYLDLLVRAAGIVVRVEQVAGL